MEELLVLSNPRRRRHKRRMSALQRKYFSNPRKRRGRRRHRSSGGGRMSVSGAGIAGMLKPALVGALGAVGTNFVLSQLSSRSIIPATFMTGKTRYLTQGAVAILLGVGASRLRAVGAGTAKQMAEGALVVTLANLITEVANDNGLGLSGMGYYLPGYNAGVAMPSAGGNPATMAGLGKYVTGPGSGMSGMRGMGRGVVPMRRRLSNVNTFAF